MESNSIEASSIVDTGKIDKNMTQFAKSDNGKLRISLVPMQIVRDMAEVRMYGDKKYHAPNNWVLVEMERYVDAMMRHLLAFMEDHDSVDEESGIPHYKHAACNMAFICAMMDDNWPKYRRHLIMEDPKLQAQLEEYHKKAAEQENLKEGE